MLECYTSLSLDYLESSAVRFSPLGSCLPLDGNQQCCYRDNAEIN